jgi:hypothetical protein
MNNYPTKAAAVSCFKWGVFAADLSCILSAWHFFAIQANSSDKNLTLPSYGSLFTKLSLSNAVWGPQISRALNRRPSSD